MPISLYYLSLCAYLYALFGKNGTQYKQSKTKDSQPANVAKKILKSSIDTTYVKIGIRTFKGLKDGKVLIETDNKEDIELLDTQIWDICGDRLETSV